MRILDPQGRLLGRFSVVDLLVLLFAMCLAPLVPFGLRVLRPLAPQITAVEPERVSPGESVRITGSRFQYGVEVVIGDLPALNTEYYGSDLVIAHVSPDLPPGRHLLRIRNLRGTSALWEKPLEVVAPGPRPEMAVIFTCAFTNLASGEVQLLETLTLQKSGPPLKENPRIVRILKRGPMSAWSGKDAQPLSGSGPTGGQPKEFVIADVAVWSEAAEIPGGKKYFYRNQPLIFKAPVRLPVGDHLLTGVIHREPDPDRPELESMGGTYE